MIKWKWFIVEGIVLWALGFFAIARPGIAAEAIVELVGWLLLFVGGIALFGGMTSQSGPRKPMSLAGGLTSLIFGMVFLLLPRGWHALLGRGCALLRVGVRVHNPPGHALIGGAMFKGHRAVWVRTHSLRSSQNPKQRF